jgi:hypothetical protein
LLQGLLEWHYLRTEFHENLQSGSKVISGGQVGDKPTFTFESRIRRIRRNNNNNNNNNNMVVIIIIVTY